MIEHDVEVGDLTVHFYDSGKIEGATLLALHGWPQSACCWFELMSRMSGLRVLAPDLPGVGASSGRPPRGDKRALAAILLQALDRLQVDRFCVAGHDVGGMIAYALMRMQPARLSCGAIIGVSVPGVAPWARVAADPALWHFGLHRVPHLPEVLVRDHVAEYFDFFYTALRGPAGGVPARKRQAYCRAYARPDALSAGFDWYRAFDEDAAANAADAGPCTVPLLYVRGGDDAAALESHASGLRQAGFARVETAPIARAGHFVPDEAPAELAALLTGFVAEFGWSELASHP